MQNFKLPSPTFNSRASRASRCRAPVTLLRFFEFCILHFEFCILFTIFDRENYYRYGKDC